MTWKTVVNNRDWYGRTPQIWTGFSLLKRQDFTIKVCIPLIRKYISTCQPGSVAWIRTNLEIYLHLEPCGGIEPQPESVWLKARWPLPAANTGYKFWSCYPNIVQDSNPLTRLVWRRTAIMLTIHSPRPASTVTKGMWIQLLQLVDANSNSGASGRLRSSDKTLSRSRYTI